MIFGKTKEDYFWAGRLERGNRLDALWEFRIFAQRFLGAGKARGRGKIETDLPVVCAVPAATVHASLGLGLVVYLGSACC